MLNASEQDEQLEQPVKQTKRAYLLNTAVKLMIVVVAFIRIFMQSIWMGKSIVPKWMVKTWELPIIYVILSDIVLMIIVANKSKAALLDNGYRQSFANYFPGDFKIEDDIS